MARSGGLGSLTVDLLLEVAEWAGGLSKAEKDAEKFAQSIDAKFSALGNKLVDNFKNMAGGIAAGFSVGAIAHFVAQTVEAADRLDELAQKTGTSVAFLGSLSAAAEMSGTNIEAVANGMVKFGVAVAKAKDPTSQQRAVFDALNISLKDANGAMKDQETLAKESMAALANIEDGAVKTAAAMVLFGKAGADLIPVMNAQRAMSDELKEASKRYGDEQAKLAVLAGQLEEQEKIANMRRKETASLIGQQLVPYVTKLMQIWNELTATTGGLSGAMQFFVNVVKTVVAIVDLAVTSVLALAKAVVGASLVMDRLTHLDFKGAMSEAKITVAEVSEQYKGWKERLDILVGALPNATTEIKKQETASNALAKAVANVKDQIIKIDMHKFRLDVEKEWPQVITTMDLSKPAEAAIKRGLERTQEMIKEYADYLRKEYATLYADIENMGKNAFDSLFAHGIGGWREMVRQMANDLKKMLLDQIWQRYGKVFINNIFGAMSQGASDYAALLRTGQGQGVGGAMGGTGDLASLWGGVKGAYNYLSGGSEGTWTQTSTGMYELQGGGGGYQWFGGGYDAATGTSSFGGAGYGLVGGVAGNAVSRWAGAGERGQQAATNYGALGAQVGSYFGPWGALIGWAIGTIAGIATDPDPDAMRKAKFGTTKGAEGLTQYTYKSALGEFGISDAEWFSDSDMGEQLKQFLGQMQSMDNAIASALKPEELEKVKARLAEFTKAYEFGMEHTGVAGLGEIVKDRLRIVAQEIAPEFVKFFDAFKGPVDELVQITAGYLAMRNATDFDPDKIAKDIKEQSDIQASQMLSYQKQKGALEELTKSWDGSAESTGKMVAALGAFQEATVMMVLAIDAAKDAIHGMFASTTEMIKLSLMTDEEAYQYHQQRAADMFAQLATETDPAKIAAISKQINDEILAAWNLLTPEQQKLLGPEFLQRIAMVDTTVATQLGLLRDAVIEDSDTVMQSITEKLAELFTKADETADKNEDAADKNLKAATTPVVVVLDHGGAVTQSG